MWRHSYSKVILQPNMFHRERIRQLARRRCYSEGISQPNVLHRERIWQPKLETQVQARCLATQYISSREDMATKVGDIAIGEGFSNPIYFIARGYGNQTFERQLKGRGYRNPIYFIATCYRNQSSETQVNGRGYPNQIYFIVWLIVQYLYWLMRQIYRSSENDAKTYILLIK